MKLIISSAPIKHSQIAFLFMCNINNTLFAIYFKALHECHVIPNAGTTNELIVICDLLCVVRSIGLNNV